MGALKGLSINKSPNSDSDLLINGHKMEIKLSTLWENQSYKFQQIRDQDYEFAVLLGISPHDVHCWVVSKKLLLENVIGLLGQHTGSKSKETSWITIDPNEPPEYIKNCGGSLSVAYSILEKLEE